GGGIPDPVRYSFWFGGAALFVAVLWTVFTTREYSPNEMERFGEAAEHPEADAQLNALAKRSLVPSFAWIIAGELVELAVSHFNLEQELYVLAGLLAAYGIASFVVILLGRAGNRTN